MQSAIKVATGKLGLQPGAAFQARVAQLAELVKAHKLVSLNPQISISTLHQELVLQYISVIKLACGSYERNVCRFLVFCVAVFMCGSHHKLVKNNETNIFPLLTERVSSIKYLL